MLTALWEMSTAKAWGIAQIFWKTGNSLRWYLVLMFCIRTSLDCAPVTSQTLYDGPLNAFDRMVRK